MISDKFVFVLNRNFISVSTTASSIKDKHFPREHIGKIGLDRELERETKTERQM